MEQKYIASVGQDDAERLSLQHEIFSTGTDNFLRRLSISQGMKILVVGCGTGDETIMIAKIVGNTGHVTGIDISSEQIEVAQDKIDQENLKNVNLITMSLEDLKQEREYDLVFCRMVLMHMKNLQSAISKMYNAVKIGGWLACEEPDLNSCYTVPQSPAFNQHIRLLSDFLIINKCEPDLGSKLYSIMHNLNYKNIEISASQPILTNPHLKRSVLLSAQSCKPQILNSGLAEKDVIDQMISDIEKEVVNNPTLLIGQVRMMQVAVKKHG